MCSLQSWNKSLLYRNEHTLKQECIPVGCVPPALYCMGGSPWQRPPWTRIPPLRGQTNTCENITFANFVCRRKNYVLNYSEYRFKRITTFTEEIGSREAGICCNNETSWILTSITWISSQEKVILVTSGLVDRVSAPPPPHVHAV